MAEVVRLGVAAGGGEACFGVVGAAGLLLAGAGVLLAGAGLLLAGAGVLLGELVGDGELELGTGLGNERCGWLLVWLGAVTSCGGCTP